MYTRGRTGTGTYRCHWWKICNTTSHKFYSLHGELNVVKVIKVHGYLKQESFKINTNQWHGWNCGHQFLEMVQQCRLQNEGWVGQVPRRSVCDFWSPEWGHVAVRWCTTCAVGLLALPPARGHQQSTTIWACFVIFLSMHKTSSNHHCRHAQRQPPLWKEIYCACPCILRPCSPMAFSVAAVISPNKSRNLSRWWGCVAHANQECPMQDDAWAKFFFPQNTYTQGDAKLLSTSGCSKELLHLRFSAHSPYVIHNLPQNTGALFAMQQWLHQQNGLFGSCWSIEWTVFDCFSTLMTISQSMLLYPCFGSSL